MVSTQLEANLEAIKLDKDTNLLPENLRLGVTCLGITGVLEEGYLTEEEYIQASSLIEDILGVVGEATVNTVGPILNDVLGVSDVIDIGGAIKEVDAVLDNILGGVN